VVMNAIYRVISVSDYLEIEELRKRLVTKAEARSAPDQDDCCDIYRLALAPIFEVLEEESPTRPSELVIIPTGRLFELPLHVAWLAKERGPLAAFFPLVFAVSVNSLLRDARFLLRRQFVAANDDLCAMIVGDRNDDFGHEIADLEWPQEHFFVAGTRPSGKLFAHRYWQPNRDSNPATWEAFQALCATQPEFLVYSGHGHYGEKRQDLPVLLELRTADSKDDCLSELDIAAKVQLRRNKLTVISACVAGLGVSRHEGEVAGFVRGFMAAGCGLLGLALWPVLVKEIEKSTNALLRSAWEKKGKHLTVNIPLELRDHYHRRKEDVETNQQWIEACPLILYI
jgi:CHAT domain-containing protein